MTEFPERMIRVKVNFILHKPTQPNDHHAIITISSTLNYQNTSRNHKLNALVHNFEGSTGR